MKLAYINSTGSEGADLVLEALANTLANKGVKTSGTVQINSGDTKNHRCDMDVRVLPDGPIIRISQSLGKEAQGCRLDPAELDRAVVLVEKELSAAADILIINKFGKHEAGGRGFRDVIATAMSREIPVVVCVNKTNLPAFLEFCGDLAEPVGANVSALIQWYQETTRVGA